MGEVVVDLEVVAEEAVEEVVAVVMAVAMVVEEEVDLAAVGVEEKAANLEGH